MGVSGAWCLLLWPETDRTYEASHCHRGLYGYVKGLILGHTNTTIINEMFPTSRNAIIIPTKYIKKHDYRFNIHYYYFLRVSVLTNNLHVYLF